MKNKNVLLNSKTRRLKGGVKIPSKQGGEKNMETKKLGVLAITVSILFLLSIASGLAFAKPGKSQGKGLPQADVIEVTEGESIQAAIDSASEGDTIVVYPGTYWENIEINVEDLTVKSLAAAPSVTIRGIVQLSAEGVTLDGFTVNPAFTFTSSLADAGILTTASNTVVKNNIVFGIRGDAKWLAANGIHVWSASGISNIKIQNNKVKDIKSDTVMGVAGIKIQGNVEEVDVLNNKVENLWSEGWSWGITVTTSSNTEEVPEKVTIKRNSMDDMSAGEWAGIALGVEADARELSFEYNNIWTEWGVQNKDYDHILDAEMNWWGHPSGPVGHGAEIYGDGDVDYEPWLRSPVPGVGK